jgi:DNA-binding response OmpR family regulator
MSRDSGRAAAADPVAGDRGLATAGMTPVTAPAPSAPRPSEPSIAERGTEPMSGGSILVVDDEGIVTEVVSRYLVRDGYSVRVAADGEPALRLAREAPPDLVILDPMLPKIDGLDVCRRPRAEGNVPIIMLTAKGEETDRIVSLTMGADDYIVKPFSPHELVARVQSVLRRAQAPLVAALLPSESAPRFADLTVPLSHPQMESNRQS